MCLNCSGVHRGLGVHISFIRSVTMDGFKVSELERMKYGGNKPWQDFFDNFKENVTIGRTFEESSIKERYDSEAGEEWKERLTAKVEGREYVPVPRAARTTGTGGIGDSGRQTPVMGGIGGGLGAQESSRSSTPLGGTRKTQNEAYFAKMGEANATRPEGLAPSQGGKFSGFGSEPMPMRSGNGTPDLLGDLQKDPVAALTKGFGWLGKSAKTGFDGWVKPNVQKVSLHAAGYWF